MVLAHADLVEAHFFDCGEGRPDVQQKAMRVDLIVPL
jgi:hypothetical protein